MNDQPIEKRKLTLFSSGQEVGHINLWVEMHAIGNKKTRMRSDYKEPIVWDISSMPETHFELRVIVWETRGVPNNDPEDMSDIFVKVAMNSLSNSLNGQTDTHIRASDGFVRIHSYFNLLICQGSFNWRMKFPIDIDQYSSTPENKGKYRLDFQIWDKDLTTSNDFLSSVTINIWDLIEEATINEARAKKYEVKSDGKKNDVFEIETIPNNMLKDEKLQKPSKIKVSIELVPMKE